ncbi:MAG: nucleotide exchange factor GrpE [Ignavibacteriaceae bacterium]
MSKDKKHENNHDAAEKLNENSDYENEQIDSEANEKIKNLELQAAEWQDKFLRKVAEFENYKRRTENDQLNLLKYAAESFIIKLLPVLDDFERSLIHVDDVKNSSQIVEGIKLVYSKLLKTVEEQGVKRIECIGQPFDVNYHEAVMQMKNDSVPPHTVIEEIQSGYIYKDRVIRHAKVIVSDESNKNDSDISEKE